MATYRPDVDAGGFAERQRHHHERRIESVRVALVTASDTRSPKTDASGRVLRDGLQAAGHEVVSYRIVPDAPDALRDALTEALDSPQVQAVITSGGTGVTARDWTYEAIAGRFDKTLEGFGELFRMLSFEQVGAAAYLSRATAGLIGTTVVFVLPGSPGAAALALEQLILPELGHVCWLAVRDQSPSSSTRSGSDRAGA